MRTDGLECGTSVCRRHLPFQPLRPESGRRRSTSYGFVQNIHANGPNVYAHEQYVLNGANPKTTYRVVLNIFPGDLNVFESTESLNFGSHHSNERRGQRSCYHVFIPADPSGLHGATVGESGPFRGDSLDYQTGCETIVLD